MSTARTGIILIGVKTSNAINTIADASCLAFPPLFLLGTTVLEAAQPGYDRVASTISELVWGQSGWAQTALFLAFAAALLLLAFKLRPATVPLAMAGLAFIIIAIFPTVAPGSHPTPGSQVHEVTAQGIALLLPVACFSLAHTWRTDSNHRSIVTLSLAAGVIGLALNLAGFLAVYGDTKWIGAVERLVMLNGLVWLELVGLHLWITHRKLAAHRTPGIWLDTLIDLIRAPGRRPVKVPMSTGDNLADRR